METNNSEKRLIAALSKAVAVGVAMRRAVTLNFVANPPRLSVKPDKLLDAVMAHDAVHLELDKLAVENGMSTGQKE